MSNIIEQVQCDVCGTLRPAASEEVRTDWRMHIVRPAGIPASPEVLASELRAADAAIAAYGVDLNDPTNLPEEIFEACLMGCQIVKQKEDSDMTRAEFRGESARYGMAMLSLGYTLAFSGGNVAPTYSWSSTYSAR